MTSADVVCTCARVTGGTKPMSGDGGQRWGRFDMGSPCQDDEVNVKQCVSEG